MIHPTPLIHSSIPVDPVRLEKLVNYIKARTTYEREQLGWQQSRAFTADSLFDKWARYEAQAEQDFEKRKKKGTIYEDSNLSQNLPYSIGSQHQDKITRDLLSSPKFFDVNPEGTEEAQLQALIAQMTIDNVKPTEMLLRVLHKESRLRDINTKLGQSVLNTLFRGHEIIRPCYERRTVPRRVALAVWMVNGVPIRTVNGEMIYEDESWIPDPRATDPKNAELILKSDPRIRLPAGTIVQKSTQKFGVNKQITESNGCDIHPVYWADFVMPETSDWLKCDFRGHFFQSSPDLVMSLYPQETWTQEGVNYWNRHRNNTLGRNQTADLVSARYPIASRMEGSVSTDPNAAALLDNSARYQRNFYEWWGNYDLDGDGHAEPIGLTLDWVDGTVIQVESSNILLPWLDIRTPHPYINMRVFPVPERWYGKSYYDVYSSWHDFGDLCWNRWNLDMEQSGNLFFRNRSAFVNPADADNIGFRTNMIYDIISSSSGAKAVQVVNTPSSADGYMEGMDRMNQRIQAHGGTMGAADPQSSALPAAQTLGGLNKILAQGDFFIAARERDIIPALNEIVRVFSDINVHAIRTDPTQAAKQLGEKNMAALMQFLEAAPDHIRDHLEVDLSNAFGQDQTAVAKAIIEILNAWMMVPTMYKEAFRPYYKQALRGLGVADPTGALVDPEAMLAQMQMQQGQPAEQQTEGEPQP